MDKEKLNNTIIINKLQSVLYYLENDILISNKNKDISIKYIQNAISIIESLKEDCAKLNELIDRKDLLIQDLEKALNKSEEGD